MPVYISHHGQVSQKISFYPREQAPELFSVCDRAFIQSERTVCRRGKGGGTVCGTAVAPAGGDDGTAPARLHEHDRQGSTVHPAETAVAYFHEDRRDTAAFIRVDEERRKQKKIKSNWVLSWDFILGSYPWDLVVVAAVAGQQ